MDRVDIVVIGAGVVGLAVAAAISAEDRETYILEQEDAYGQGTSSRLRNGKTKRDIYAPLSAEAAAGCRRAARRCSAMRVASTVAIPSISST